MIHANKKGTPARAFSAAVDITASLHLLFASVPTIKNQR